MITLFITVAAVAFAVTVCLAVFGSVLTVRAFRNDYGGLIFVGSVVTIIGMLTSVILAVGSVSMLGEFALIEVYGRVIAQVPVEVIQAVCQEVDCKQLVAALPELDLSELPTGLEVKVK